MVANRNLWETGYLPAGGADGLERLRELVNGGLDILRDTASRRVGPVAPGGPAGVAAAAAELFRRLDPAGGNRDRDAFGDLVRAYATWSVDLTHHAAVARMQCAPAVEAAAADLIATVTNQSLHAWESGPFALELERWLVSWLVALVGYDPGAGGTFTAGGSVSNLMALLLARDHNLSRRVGAATFRDGVTGLGVRPVVLCTAATHFSIARSVGIVGLGSGSILRVPDDEKGRMIPDAADRMLAELPDDRPPVALVACAGTTDFGEVDPLPELAAIARRHGVWLHADAAYGGGALFSQRLKTMLTGIEQVDSITLDLHKFGWTPASSGVFLVRRAEFLDSWSGQTTTLNADDDKVAGYYGRYESSLQATRRVDALKIATVLLTLGEQGLGDMVEACHRQALHAARRILGEPRLELAAEPALSTVVFRYLPESAGDADAFNGELRRRLMAEGKVLMARTRVPRPDGDPVFLKLMLLNPETTSDQIDEIVADVLAVAARMETAVPA
ncbi:pyridoxal phosphate-dependent decarboxylase family protein [Amycolatopsis aidingensis]|uniref:pyridoxal phosphate-dependent decarboxylase family protein n=1 Tax=Amycolatopsis aidingensis TaxID=2842453 RepID=UPI001C0D9F5C|nr:pyridoxal-dependent decarboxylase [Amycolatopsis aidingensis]